MSHKEKSKLFCQRGCLDLIKTIYFGWNGTGFVGVLRRDLSMIVSETNRLARLNATTRAQKIIVFHFCTPPT